MITHDLARQSDAPALYPRRARHLSAPLAHCSEEYAHNPEQVSTLNASENKAIV
jgi:hypothetical protein